MKATRIYPAKVIKVIDGDTVDLLIDMGFNTHLKERVRLLGIDTPERGQEGYHEAKAFLEQNYLGKEILVNTEKGKGSFGRWLGVLYDTMSGCNINEHMMNLGLARVYGDSSPVQKEASPSKA